MDDRVPAQPPRPAALGQPINTVPQSIHRSSAAASPSAVAPQTTSPLLQRSALARTATVWSAAAALVVGVVTACTDQTTASQSMMATSQAVACVSVEQVLQIAQHSSAGNQKALLDEISNALNSGSCQWLFVGNQVTVYEQGEVYSRISSPGNATAVRAHSAREWFVLSEQAAFSPLWSSN